MNVYQSVTRLLAPLTVSAMVIACGSGSAPPPAPAAQSAPAARNSHQDWPTGDYRVVEGWPKPLPDTRHSHAGWTWGSFGGVYAENPDRIWIAMRGELPLPQGAAPWTPYVALQSAARQFDRQWRRDDRDLRAGAEARMGAAVRALDLRVERRRRPRRRVAASRQAVRAAALRTRTAPDQDQPVRHGEARLDHRRPAAHDLPLHLRRKAGAQQGRARRSAAAVRTPSIGRPTSRGCRTALTSSPTATAARASPSTTRTTTSSRTGDSRRRIRRTRDRTSSTPSTASPSAPIAGCSSSIAVTHACRCSTRTASSSTCGRCGRRTGRRARTR